MSADILRRAAALMRERAEAATDERGTWFKAATLPELTDDIVNRTDGAFIEAWHPAVALAVADWLDHAARRAAQTVPDIDERALAVAVAYLGSAS